MTTHHRLSATTDTLELRQLRELNDRIQARGSVPVTAESLDITGETIVTSPEAWRRAVTHGQAAASPRLLPGTAVLELIRVEGSPSFGYIWGQFHSAGFHDSQQDAPRLDAPLHTAALRKLSEHYHLRHTWGVPDVAEPTGSKFQQVTERPR